MRESRLLPTKQELRREMRRRRREVTPEDRARASREICRRLLLRPDIAALSPARRFFAMYLASPDEIDLAPLISALAALDVPLASPRWNGATYALNRLTRAPGGEFQLREGPHGILEPLTEDEIAPGEVALWIVPGLAFTPSGGRLGYGGGWYDRLLAAAAPGALTLGVAYSFQMVKDLPLEPHDRKLCDIIVDNYELQ